MGLAKRVVLGLTLSVRGFVGHDSHDERRLVNGEGRVQGRLYRVPPHPDFAGDDAFAINILGKPPTARRDSRNGKYEIAEPVTTKP
jgi:hypothetical protein